MLEFIEGLTTGLTWEDIVVWLGLMTDVLLKLGFLSILIESTVEIVKPFLDKDRSHSKAALTALGIAVPITILSGLNVYSALGIHLRVPGVEAAWNDVFELVFGSLATGIILSRGSNYWHEFYKRLERYMPWKRPK